MTTKKPAYRKDSYTEKLQDPRWQRKRLEVLEREKFTCQDCGATDRTLHVHHRYYISHRHPWEYPDFCYQVLCRECHEDLKSESEERRQADYSYEDWEHGLDWFGEKRIFDMFMEESISKDYAYAHVKP